MNGGAVLSLGGKEGGIGIGGADGGTDTEESGGCDTDNEESGGCCASHCWPSPTALVVFATGSEVGC